MEAIKNAVEPWREYTVYAPIGIILCAIPWLILMKITEKIPYIDAAHLRKTLLALLFTGAYLYMWTQGSNPHDAEVKQNTFADEVFLLLAGGYYIVHTQESYRRITHDFLYVVFIILVVIHQEVGALAIIYGFLVVAPNVFLMLSQFVEKLNCTTVTWSLKHLSIIVYFLSNLDICEMGHNIVLNEKVPAHIMIVFTFILIFQFLNIIEDVCGLMGGHEEPKPKPCNLRVYRIRCIPCPSKALCKKK
nr:uncharacterized protein LOC106690429 [Halyomorpha halys]